MREPPPLAELRSVSAFFVCPPELDVQEPSTLPRLQDAVVAIQRELARLGRPQLDVLGDKGIGFVGVFGLPPQAHDDDAVRAVDAALPVRAALTAHDMKASVGVVTGVAWAGRAGAIDRRCSDVVGFVTTLAARLMQSAGNGVLVCAQTRRLAGRAVELETLVPTHGLGGVAARHFPV